MMAGEGDPVRLLLIDGTVLVGPIDYPNDGWVRMYSTDGAAHDILIKVRAVTAAQASTTKSASPEIGAPS